LAQAKGAHFQWNEVLQTTRLGSSDGV